MSLTHAVTFIEPDVPASAVAFLGPWIAVRTFWKETFSNIKLPSEKEEIAESWAV